MKIPLLLKKKRTINILDKTLNACKLVLSIILLLIKIYIFMQFFLQKCPFHSWKDLNNRHKLQISAGYKFTKKNRLLSNQLFKVWNSKGLWHQDTNCYLWQILSSYTYFTCNCFLSYYEGRYLELFKNLVLAS